MTKKKRPAICDYLGGPGKKTPLGVKIPPLTKKEIEIGRSLDKKAKALLAGKISQKDSDEFFSNLDKVIYSLTKYYIYKNKESKNGKNFKM